MDPPQDTSFFPNQSLIVLESLWGENPPTGPQPANQLKSPSLWFGDTAPRPAVPATVPLRRDPHPIPLHYHHPTPIPGAHGITPSQPPAPVGSGYHGSHGHPDGGSPGGHPGGSYPPSAGGGFPPGGGGGGFPPGGGGGGSGPPSGGGIPPSGGGGPPGGGGGGPPGSGGGPPGPPSGPPVLPTYPVPSKPFTMKPDMSLFPKLSDDADYLKWFCKFNAVADGTGVGDVCDFSYVPAPGEECSFQNKVKWIYAVLNEKITTTTGRDLLLKHSRTRDGRMVLYELDRNARTSTAAYIRSRDLHTRLVTLRLDSSWAHPLADFFSLFTRLLYEYNELAPTPATRTTSDTARILLERAIEPCKPLNEIHHRELMHIAQGGVPLDFIGFLSLGRSTAESVDRRRPTRTPGTPSGRRRANVTEISGHSDAPPGSPDALQINTVSSSRASMQTTSPSVQPSSKRILICRDKRSPTVGLEPIIQMELVNVPSRRSLPGLDP